MNTHLIHVQASLYQALQQMDEQRVKFLVAVDSQGVVVGTLTDGDVRRRILRGNFLQESIDGAICKDFTSVSQGDGLLQILEAFQNPKIEFLPVLEENGRLFNIITRRGLHVLLLQNQKFQSNFDFDTLDENVLEHEIFARPWGFYKTTILNALFQSKIIHIMPMQALSLQSHDRREEYWIIISGNGVVQIGESVHPVLPGGTYFIPKGCKHRLINNSETETLILTEVQLGDYFGEDDIRRYEDQYGRD